MPIQTALTNLQAENIASCDKAKLTDLRNVQINTRKTSADRVLDFAEQVKNPYLFKVGDIAVSVVYCGAKSLSDLLASVLKAG